MASVSAIICGVKIENMLVMNSKFDGYDPHHKERFKAGTQIVYKPKDKLTPEQINAIYGTGKVYNLAVQWPLKNATPADSVPTSARLTTVNPNTIKKVNFIPSEFQVNIRDSLLNESEHLLVEALAGSGKTSTLVWLLQELHLRGLTKNKRIIYLAFNVSIKEELIEQLKGTGVPAMTTHGFGFKLLVNKYAKGKANQIKVSDNKGSNIFQKILCDANGYSYSKEAFAAVRRTEEYEARSAVLDLVSYSKNWGVFPKKDENNNLYFGDEERATISMFFDYYDIEYDVEKFTPAELVEYACKVLIACIPRPGESLSEIMFDDMLYLPLVLNLPMPHYDLVCTDESQDFNGCQILMLERLAT